MVRADDSLSLLIAGIAKDVSRAFDDVLAAAGGSTPTWQVLRALSSGGHRTQAHLDALERAGLVTRERADSNRRVQRVTVTESGEQLFLRLRRAASSFDGRLRAGLEDGDVAALRRLLGQLVENAEPD
jgi:MarR family transcriptional regulator for hemolysin